MHTLRPPSYLSTFYRDSPSTPSQLRVNQSVQVGRRLNMNLSSYLVVYTIALTMELNYLRCSKVASYL